MIKLVDLSRVIETGMPVYPGDAQTKLTQTRHIEKDSYNNHRLEISMHTGTHLDAPMHLLDRNEYMAELPLATFIGQGCLLDVRGQREVRWQNQFETTIPAQGIVLLWSGHDRLYGQEEYYLDYPSVGLDFCRRLLDKEIKLLGIDWPSPDYQPFPVHKLLLSHNVCILENLTNLDQLSGVAGFEVMAFPLKLRADGSPTRAVARIS